MHPQALSFLPAQAGPQSVPRREYPRRGLSGCGYALPAQATGIWFLTTGSGFYTISHVNIRFRLGAIAQDFQLFRIALDLIYEIVDYTVR